MAGPCTPSDRQVALAHLGTGRGSMTGTIPGSPGSDPTHTRGPQEAHPPCHLPLGSLYPPKMKGLRITLGALTCSPRACSGHIQTFLHEYKGCKSASSRRGAQCCQPTASALRAWSCTEGKATKPPVTHTETMSRLHFQPGL